MTLHSARARERWRRMAGLAAGAAFAIAGIGAGAGAGYAASLAHRAAVRAAYGFDIHARADWTRLEAQWRAGRFVIDTPRRFAFVGSLAGGGCATAFVALIAAWRLPRAVTGGARALAAKFRAAAKQGTEPVSRAAGVAMPVPAAAGAPSAVPSALPPRPDGAGLEAERQRIFEAAKAQTDKALAEAAASVIDNTQNEVLQEAERRAQAAGPSAPAARADDGGAERIAAIARVRRDAAEVDAHLLDAAAFGCDLAIVVGRTLVAANMFVDRGDWTAVDSADAQTWRDGDHAIDSPAYALGETVQKLRDQLGDRLRIRDMEVRGILCIAGRAALLSVNDDCMWSNYAVDVVDASADESAGPMLDSVSSRLRELAGDATPPDAVGAFEAYVELSRKVAA